MITLDIEDNFIKIMSVKGRQVETAASLPLEPGLVQDGVIIDKPTVARRISELMSVNGISEKSAVVGISGIHALYRTIPIPKIPKNLLNEAVQREAERAMPVPLNELYTSWQAIELSDIETKICIVGIPRNTVDAMIDTLHQAGLQPDALEVRPLALARVTDERNAVIINVQQISFDIVVMIDGIPEILRSLPFPAGATSPDEKIAEVKEELERTIAYYNSGHTGSEIATGMATFVSGELGAMMAPALERRVKPLPQILSYTDSLNASEYTSNIGMALRQARAASPALVSLNVMPEVYLPKPFPVIQLVSWAFILLGIAFLIMFGVLTWQKYRDTVNLQKQVDNISAQVISKQGATSVIRELQTKIDQTQKSGAAFTNPLDNAKEQRAKVNEDLSKATSLLPGIVTLKSIGYSNQVMTITGNAPDETIVVEYVRDLRNSGQFSSVLIASMSEIEYNRWQFSWTAK